MSANKRVFPADTSIEWCPFREAEQNLPDYLYFFNRDITLTKPGAQLFEDFLDEHAPNEWCYVWTKRQRVDRCGWQITGQRIGIKCPEIALLFRIRFDIDVEPLHNYRMVRNVNNVWELRHND